MTTYRPDRIISGGQTGADEAGLEAAKFLCIPTGGTAPKGYRIKKYDGSDGVNPKLASFGLRQHSSSTYPPRTECNIVDSCGTAWFGNPDSRGGKLTLRLAKKHGKPTIINPSPAELQAWCVEYKISVLNIAGNHHSPEAETIFETTYQTIVTAFADNSSEKRYKLSELYELYLLGETEIEEYKGGNDLICQQEREFCLGNIEQRYEDYKERLFYPQGGGPARAATAKDRDRWIQQDRKTYQRLKPLLTEWIRQVDDIVTTLNRYFPDYKTEEFGTIWIRSFVVVLAKLGLLEWDVPSEMATTLDVIDFAFSDDLIDSPNSLAEHAFTEGRFDVLLATGIVRPEPIDPRDYWNEQIQKWFGSSMLKWCKICHYDVVRGLHPTLDGLAKLDVPSSVAAALSDMGLSLNPDGSEKSGYYNNENVFVKRYQTSRFCKDLAFSMHRIPQHPEDQEPESRDVLDHKAFIDWHHQSVAQVGEASVRAIYDLFGIRWDVIQNVLITLPNIWWAVLGVDPKKLPSMYELHQIYRAQMKKVHPDVGGSEELAKQVNLAYQRGLQAINGR